MKQNYYKPSLIDSSGSKLKFKSSICQHSSGIVPTHDHHPQKHIEELLKMPAQGSLLIDGGIEAILAIAVIDGTICNNGNKTLSMRRYSARLTHHKPKIK